MILHVCPTCSKSQELSDDYLGIVFVCPACHDTAEVKNMLTVGVAPVETPSLASAQRYPHLRQKPGRLHIKKEKAWYERDIIPSPIPAPTKTDIPWSCPRCLHYGCADIRCHGMSGAGLLLLATPIGSFFVCGVAGGTLGPEIVGLLIALPILSLLFFFFVVITFGDKMFNRYAAHCEKCGYWFR